MLAWLPSFHADPGLIGLTLVAAMVNGSIGYGFSTLVVPLALLIYPSKTLTPGLVLAEIVLNLLALLINRRAVPLVFWRVFPMMLASLPGIALGVTLLQSASPDALRFGTYALLLPLVLMQAAGLRRPLPRGSRADLPVGFGIGVLYSCTTISGPPLGLLFNNQGLAQDEFRAAISLFRITESCATALAFSFLSVFTVESVSLSIQILPCILIGLPIGRLAVSLIAPETFRRICMAADAWLISFGLSRLISTYGGIWAHLAYAPMAVVLLLDGVILVRYFTAAAETRSGAPASPLSSEKAD